MSNQGANEEINPALVVWVIAALIFSILIFIIIKSPMVLKAGFFVRILAVIAGTIFGSMGALLGDAIRRFAMPDSVYTTGGISQLIWIKLFWLCGPQVIGLVIGTALGGVLILKAF